MLTRRTAITSMLAAATVPILARAAARATVPTRGFNLTEWLAPEPRVPATSTLRRLRDLGFETIRLPVGLNGISAATLPQIAQVLDRTTSVGFRAILDLHAGDGDQASLKAAWTQLAPLLAGTDPARVYPELLNEPALEPADFLPLRDELASIVRAHAPDHTIIWGPARYQGIWELDSIPPLDDPNQIVTLHYYSPLTFTHQCENWNNSPLERIGNLPFPARRDDPRVEAVAASLNDTDRAVLDEAFLAPWTTAQINADFATAGDWSRRTGIPLMLGEFGVLDFCVDQASRATWIRAVRRAAEEKRIGWVYWELDNGFGFVSSRDDGAEFNHDIIAALLA